MDSIMYNGIQTPMIASAIALGASILGIIFVVMRAKSAKKLEN
jgi:hypothetical protein